MTVLAYATTYAHFTPEFSTFNPPCWTLFIEIHFYILLPIVYLLLRRCTEYAPVITWLLFLLVPFFMRFDTHYRSDETFYAWLTAYNLFPRSFDCFSWGILFAIIFKNMETVLR